MMARTGDEPSFNMLMDQYHAARNSLEDELPLAENALMISTTKQDIQIISKNLQQLGDRYVQLWKDLSVTNEFYDLWCYKSAPSGAHNAMSAMTNAFADLYVLVVTF